MNKKLKSVLIGILFSALASSAFADDHHEESGEEPHHEHGEEAEENPAVGADKGITEVSHENGFKLSPEATKRFKITTRAAGSNSTITLPRTAIFFGLEERNLFRLRNGFFKRIDFKTVSKTAADYVVSSEELQANDQIVISGIGFLRIAEIASQGGGAVGHSH